MFCNLLYYHTYDNIRFLLEKSSSFMSFSFFDSWPHAVELVVTTSQERYQIISEVGRNLTNCKYAVLLFIVSPFDLKVWGCIVIDREIQGSGLEGPIPSSISVLKNLTELWVKLSMLIVLELHCRCKVLFIFNNSLIMQFYAEGSVTCMEKVQIFLP